MRSYAASRIDVYRADLERFKARWDQLKPKDEMLETGDHAALLVCLQTIRDKQQEFEELELVRTKLLYVYFYSGLFTKRFRMFKVFGIFISFIVCHMKNLYKIIFSYDSGVKRSHLVQLRPKVWLSCALLSEDCAYFNLETPSFSVAEETKRDMEECSQMWGLYEEWHQGFSEKAQEDWISFR